VWNSILASCRNMPVGYSKFCVVVWISKEPPVPGFSKNQNQRTGWFRVLFKNQNQSTSQFRIFQNPQGPDSFQEKSDGSFPVFPRFFDFETSFLGQLWGRVTHIYICWLDSGGTYQKNNICWFTYGGEGLRKWEPPVIYLHNQSDYQKRTNTASKNRPALDIRVICGTASKRKKILFLIGQQY